MQMDSIYRKPLEDDEIVDEIIFRTVPRFKTSGVSGDEWRTSVVVEFRKKNVLVLLRTFTDMKYATARVPSLLLTLNEEDAYHGPHIDDRCDQPGCFMKAKVTYRLKNEYIRGLGPLPPTTLTPIRRFCTDHSGRGDCAMEDAMDNYEVVETKKQ